MDKIKDGVSVEEVENFARKYTMEVFSCLAILVASVSSMYDFFTGPKLTILFAGLGIILGIFIPVPVERGLKQYYGFCHKQEKMTQMIMGFVKIVVGLFIPFVLFGMIGLLAGTSYHYYMRHAQVVKENKPSKGKKSAHLDEHD